MKVLSRLSKYAVLIVFALLIVLPQLSHAVVKFDPTEALANVDVQSDSTPEIWIVNIINFVLGLLGLIAVVLVIYSGLLWMTSAGNSDKVEKARGILINATIGLLIILASYGISYYVFNNLAAFTGVGSS